MGRDSSVSIVTCYGLDGLGIESWWGARLSTPVQTGPGAHPVSYTIGAGSFPGVKWLGRGVDHPPHVAPRSKKEYNYTSTPPLGLHGLLYSELFKEHEVDHSPHLLPNAPIPLLPAYACMVWTRTTLTLPLLVLRFHPVEGLFVAGVSW